MDKTTMQRSSNRAMLRQRPMSQPPIKFVGLEERIGGNGRAGLAAAATTCERDKEREESTDQKPRLKKFGARDRGQFRDIVGLPLEDLDENAAQKRSALSRSEFQPDCLSPLTSGSSSSSLSSSTLSLTTSDSASTVLAAPSERKARGTTSSSLPSTDEDENEDEEEDEEANCQSSSSSSGISSTGSDPMCGQRRLERRVHLIRRLQLEANETAAAGGLVLLERARRVVMSALREVNSSGQRESGWLVAQTRDQLQWSRLRTDERDKQQSGAERVPAGQIVDCLQEHELLVWIIDRKVPLEPNANSPSALTVDGVSGRESIRDSVSSSFSSSSSPSSSSSSPSNSLDGDAFAGCGNLIGVCDESPTTDRNENETDTELHGEAKRCTAVRSLESFVWLCAGQQDAQELRAFWLATLDQSISLEEIDSRSVHACSRLLESNHHQARASACRRQLNIDDNKSVAARGGSKGEDQQTGTIRKCTGDRRHVEGAEQAVGTDAPQLLIGESEPAVEETNHSIGIAAAADETAPDHSSSCCFANPPLHRRTTIAPLKQTEPELQQVDAVERRGADDHLSSSSAPRHSNQGEGYEHKPRAGAASVQTDQAPPAVKPRTSILKRQLQQQLSLENQRKETNDDRRLEQPRSMPISRTSLLNRSMKLPPSAQRPKSILRRNPALSQRQAVPCAEQRANVSQVIDDEAAEKFGQTTRDRHRAEGPECVLKTETIAKTNARQKAALSEAKTASNQLAAIEPGARSSCAEQTSSSSKSNSRKLVRSNHLGDKSAQSLTSNEPIIVAGNQQHRQVLQTSTSDKKPIERRKSVHLIAVRSNASDCAVVVDKEKRLADGSEAIVTTSITRAIDGAESTPKPPASKVEFVATNLEAQDRERAFERLRSRASCYDISRLMSKNSTLQNQLAKLRASAAADKAKSSSKVEAGQGACGSSSEQLTIVQVRQTSKGDVPTAEEVKPLNDPTSVSSKESATELKTPVEPAKIKSILKPPKSEAKQANEIPLKRSQCDVEIESGSDTEVEKSPGTGDEEQLASQDKEEKPRLGKFSLLRQSFNQKTISSMLKFSSRASMRIKSTIGAAGDEAKKKPSVDQAIKEPINPLGGAQMSKAPGQKQHEQLEQQLTEQATSLVLHNHHQQQQQQQQMLIQRQRQQHQQKQLIFQQQYTAAIHHQQQQQQQMIQRQQQYAAAYAYANQFIATQQALILPAPVVATPGPLGGPMMPMNHHQHYQQMTHQMVSLIPQAPMNARSGLKRSVSKASMFAVQQQQRLMPITAVANHHSSVNIVYAQSAPSAVTQVQQAQQQQNSTNQATAKNPTSNGRSSLGASMRKTVRSILINKSSPSITTRPNQNSGTSMPDMDHQRKAKQAPPKGVLKNHRESMKASAIGGGSALALNSEGSSDGDHSSSTLEGDHHQSKSMIRQSSLTAINKGPNPSLKSALKKSRPAEISSSASSLSADQRLSTSQRLSSSIGTLSRRQIAPELHDDDVDHFKRSVAVRCSRWNRSPSQEGGSRSSSSDSLTESQTRSAMSSRISNGASATRRKNVTFSNKLTTSIM